jgi:hypothetical protein
VCDSCAEGTAQPDPGAAQCLACDTASPVGATECRPCAQPVSTGANPLASDALFILRTAVGSETCVECVCDVDASGSVRASDSLSALRAAVGLNVTTRCPACIVSAIVGATGAVLTSADGLLTITLPAGALPAGTVVTVTGLAQPALPDELGGAAGSYGYLLEPDGADFAVAAEVSFLADATVNGVGDSFGAAAALLFAAADGEPQLLADPVVEVDADLDAAFATATLARGGVILAAPLAALAVTVDGVPASETTEDSVDVGISIAHDGSDARYRDTSFDEFVPHGGAIDQVLPQAEPGRNADTFTYGCSAAGAALYDAEIGVIYDVAALVDAVFGVGSSTQAGSTELVFAASKSVTCQ